MIKIKPGVTLANLQPQLLIALMAADSLYRGYGQDLVITSGNDGKHKYKSLHYAGSAVDIRTYMLTGEQTISIANELSFALGADFDILVESNHIHIEYQPVK